MTVDPAYDELLVLRCQDGDSLALDELVGRWQSRFVGHACRLTGQPEAAHDAVQDAWMAIVAGIGRLDDPARFGSCARSSGSSSKSPAWARSCQPKQWRVAGSGL